MPKLIPGSPAHKRSLKRHAKAEARAESKRLARARNLAQKNAAYKKGQDIGKIPAVADPKRRAAAEASFRVFCETYLSAEIFYMPWSDDLLRVIGKIERVVIDHDTLAVAMPRGSGKTQLCLSAVLWGVLTGRHHFAVYIGATGAAANEGIEWFRDQLSGNPLLLADFPEVCFPIMKLDGRNRSGQRHKGVRTNIKWSGNKLRLPTIPGSKVSGAIIAAASLQGRIRGMWIKLPGGRVERPTLAVCDDPQTPESARSQGPNGQTTHRLKTIKLDVRGLAGPNAQCGILVPCTVICRGDLADQLLDHKLYPAFRGERTKRLKSPATNKALWETYRELRDREDRASESYAESTEFYRARMATCGRELDKPGQCATCKRAAECMDCGAVVDWAARKDDPRNLSAVQATMHALYEYGAEGFAAEFQNDPLADAGSENRLTEAVILSRVSGRPVGEVPLDAVELTLGGDVQQYSLWYCIVAWTRNFTGHVVEYGTWPRQKLLTFTKAEIQNSDNNLQAKYPGRGVEGTIQAAVEDFISKQRERNFTRAGGAGLMQIGRVFVDSGKWPNAIAAAKLKAGGSAMELCKGFGIKAGVKPLASRPRKPGERWDEEGFWYYPTTKGTREFPFCLIDTNHWKARIHDAFLTAPGDPGALTLFGDDPRRHALFASHILAETWEPTTGHGREVREFTLKPNRPDNEWLDCLVYAMVAASRQGCRRGGAVQRLVTVRRRRVSVDKMIAQSNQKRSMGM